MYTVIFHRESNDTSGDRSPSVLKIKYCNSLKDVYDYVKFETFEQFRLKNEWRVFNGLMYYYGDHGFLVMKDGVVVDVDYTFTDAFGEWDIPSEYDDDLCSMISDSKLAAGKIFRLSEEFKTNYVDKEEKLLRAAIVEEKETKKKEDQERKERDLLKVLMEKYPEVK